MNKLHAAGMCVAGLPMIRFKHPKDCHKQLSEECKKGGFPEIDRTIGQSAIADIYRKGEARARNEQSGWSFCF